MKLVSNFSFTPKYPAPVNLILWMCNLLSDLNWTSQWAGGDPHTCTGGSGSRHGLRWTEGPWGFVNEGVLVSTGSEGVWVITRAFQSCSAGEGEQDFTLWTCIMCHSWQSCVCPGSLTGWPCWNPLCVPRLSRTHESTRILLGPDRVCGWISAARSNKSQVPEMSGFSTSHKIPRLILFLNPLYRWLMGIVKELNLKGIWWILVYAKYCQNVKENAERTVLLCSATVVL